MVVLKRSFLWSLEALKVQSWIKPAWMWRWECGGWWEKQIRGEVEKDREGRVYLQSAPERRDHE